MKMTKRILSFVLCLAMIVGIIPMSVFAVDGTAEGDFTPAGDTDYLFFATDRHANTSVIGNIINNMENVIGEDKLEYLGLGGDMVGSGNSHPAYNSSTVLSEVTGATTSLSAANVDIVAGIHDMNVTDDEGIVLPYMDGCGLLYEGDKYYVYGVEEYCISEDSNEANWKAQSEAFVTWANGSDIDKNKVIVVLSHYPLHAKRDDNDGAYYWHQALNTVATGSASNDTTVERNIVFFHGHNHTVDKNEYVYNVGDTMSIQNGSGTTSDTIYYTYATAGYLNQNSKATLMAITDSTITLTKYGTSGSGTAMTTVTRAIPQKLAVTGKIDYTVDGSIVAPTAVNVTYLRADNTTFTSTITEGYKLTKITDADGTTYTVDGFTFPAAGTYTLTYTCTLGGYQANAELAVTVEEAESSTGTVTYVDHQITIQATEEGLTGIDAEYVYTEYDLSDVYTDYIAYDVTLEGHTEGNEVFYSFLVVDNMDTTNLELYHVSEDGTTRTPITYELVTDVQGNQYVEFTTALTGVFAYGSPNVPNGYVASKLTMIGVPTDTFVGSLYLVDAVFTVTYTKEGEEDFVRVLTANDWNDDNWTCAYDQIGGQTFTFTFDDVSASQTINVWGKTFIDDATDVTVTVGDSEHGVNNVTVEKLNEDLSDALQYVIAGDNYVAYEIGLGFADNYATKNEQKTVTLPIPEGVTNPVVYYVFADRSQVSERACTISEDGKYITFTTTHFSTYVVGEGVSIDVPENETATGSSTVPGEKKTVYVLTTSISAGNDYLIVNGNAAGSYYALANNSGSVAATGVTVKSGDIDGDGDTDTYIELDDATDELWTVSGSYTFECEDGYLYRASTQNTSTYVPRISDNSTTWSYSTSNHRLSYTRQNTTYYLYYNSGWKVSTSTNNAGSIYFYVPQEIDTTTTVSGTYTIDGEDKTVAAIKGVTVDLSAVLNFAPASGNATTDDVSTTATYEIVTVDANNNTVNGDPLGVISGINGNVATLSGNTGKALVKVSYETDFGTVTDYIIVETTTPDHYSIQLHLNNNGTLGAEITAPVALKGVKAGDTYSVWAVVKACAEAHDGEDHTDGVDLGALGDALKWSVSDESIATIDPTTGVITFTGNNYGTFDVTVKYTGADGVNYEDTITISATDSQYVVPGDGTNDFPEYPNQGAIRFDKTATAVGAFSETGIAKVEISMTGVPYTEGNELDVVLVLDMTGSMDDVSNSSSKPTGYTRVDATIASAKAFIKSIVINEDGTYNDNRIGIYVFNKNGASTLYDLAAIDTDAKLQTLIGKIADGGTEFDSNYTEGKLDTIWGDYGASGGTPYDDGLAKAQSVLATAKTDGTGNDRQQFCVFMTDGVPTSYAYVNGTTYGTHSSASAIAGMLTSASDYATRDTDYKYEYYSTEMKKAGVTVYSVGVGLFNENNAWSGSATQCGNLASALLNDISGPANETTQPDAVSTSTLSKKDSYFFSVDDADAGTEMTKIFSNIAQKIVEAAKNVVVEDKIGSNYTLNLKLPAGLTSADTGMEEFYIQIVEYELDANKERTGNPNVKENFTFNANGTLKSHTVGGVACTDCNHVTFTNGVVTAIDGTYFDYRSDSTGEYLTWNEEKIGTTELAMQYFAYLEGSGGVDPENAIEAGTYYTNEYATLTYTNFQGKEVQQEFPVPQMTWNGAQVRYVFYLVNEQGQPVNRQGRVIPFAEAVYVTDIFFDVMTWNNLEKYESFDAALKAEEILPDVYELYDQGASYDIHVFENEFGSNLNNHFIIGSSFTQEQVTAGAAAWTTYVFNNKSDATKYTVPGYYAKGETFWCIGTGTVSLGADGKPNGYTRGSGETSQVTVYYSGDLNLTTEEVEKLDPEVKDVWSLIRTADAYTTDGNGNYCLYYKDTEGNWSTIVSKKSDHQVETSFDFGNTAVAFAVVWKPGLKEDTVVVDFGLDVVIDVITNDIMIPGIVGLSNNPVSRFEQDITPYDQQQMANTPIDLKIGDLKIGTAALITNDNAHIRVTFDKTNGMQFNQPVSFYYEAKVEYYDDNNVLVTKYMYSKVTVIPATTVYYEDSFIANDDLKVYEWDYSANNWGETPTTGVGTGTFDWMLEGTTTSATQAQDRPGKSQISASVDADNLYGTDGAYSSMSTYSMGSALKVHVDYDHMATASFNFYGTGFDVISMTNSVTGTIIVNVKDADGNQVGSYTVNTYYGYTYTDGEWVKDTSGAALYQVPVMKVEGLAYGKYTAEIKVVYDPIFDQGLYGDAASYDFYLDAIRIYDPTGVASGSVENDTVSGAYNADGEGWPVYEELRNIVIDAATINEEGGESEISGLVFVDGIDETASASDYISYGPNNELYLASGQAIIFNLDQTYASILKDVQIGMKVATGEAEYKIYNATVSGNTVTESNVMTGTVKTATDMYYSINDLAADTIIIQNTGTGVLSLTNIKFTFSENPNITGTLVYVNKDVVLKILGNQQTNDEFETPDGGEVILPEEIITAVEIPDSVTAGEMITVKVTTVGEADSVTVNGVNAWYSEQEDGTRVWTAKIAAEKAGVKDISIVAVIEGEEADDEDVVANASKSVMVAPATFTVSAPTYVITGKAFDIQVTTSNDISYITVEGNKVETTSTATADGKLVWTYSATAQTAGTLEVEVIGYVAQGEDSAVKVAASTVNIEVYAPFIPTKFEVSAPDSVYTGSSITVTVTTSTDVEVVEINGELISTYRYRNGSRIWTAKIATSEDDITNGKTISVVAYDQNGIESKTVTKTVVVQEVQKWVDSTIGSIINNLLGWLFG